MIDAVCSYGGFTACYYACDNNILFFGNMQPFQLYLFWFWVCFVFADCYPWMFPGIVNPREVIKKYFTICHSPNFSLTNVFNV